MSTRHTEFAVYSRSNKTIGGSEIATELARLEAVAPNKNTYVAFKVRGKWFIAETLAQHTSDHGEKVVKEGGS